LSQPRLCHCAAAFVVSSELIEVVVFGGYNEYKETLSDTLILRLGKLCNKYIQ